MKPSFYNVTFVSSMCQVYFTKEKVKLFIFLPLNIQWSLCYNFTQIYFIKFSMKKYLFPIFVISKFLKICIQFNIKAMESTMVSKWNLNKIWIYFLVFLLKIISFFSNSLLINSHNLTITLSKYFRKCNAL